MAPQLLPLGSILNGESQLYPATRLWVGSNYGQDEARALIFVCWVLFFLCQQKKRRKHPHLWLIHQLTHPSPTTAKITASQRHPNPTAKITTSQRHPNPTARITSQRLHSLLLPDQLSPTLVRDRCPPFPERADPELQSKWISIDWNPVGFQIIPFFFLGVFGHRILLLSTGKSLTKPSCLFKPQQPQSTAILPPETKNLESLSHWKQDAISTNSAWLAPSYFMPMSEAPSFVSSNACLMCNLIIWLQQHNCVIVMYCASWLEGEGRHLLSDVESTEQQQQYWGHRRNPRRL